MAIKKFKPTDIINPNYSESYLRLHNITDNNCCGINRIICESMGRIFFSTLVDRVNAASMPGKLNLAVVVLDVNDSEMAFQLALEKCKFVLFKTWLNKDTGNKLALYGKYVKPQV